MGAVLWSAVLHAVLHSTQLLQPLQMVHEIQATGKACSDAIAAYLQLTLSRI